MDINFFVLFYSRLTTFFLRANTRAETAIKKHSVEKALIPIASKESWVF
tara:strand:- start:674 stop:820 length:147 start_codon:yes stop_codon:yes gene_type:complete